MSWIMGGGAKVIGALFGALGFGLLFLSTLTLGFERWEMHKNELVGKGKMICTAEYVQAKMASATKKADEEKERAIEVAKASDEAVGALKDEYDNLSSEYATLRAAVDAQPTADPGRCLSDGVLGKFRGNRKVEGTGSGAGRGKPGS